MNELEAFLKRRSELFTKTLKDNDREILNALPQDVVVKKTELLITRRSGEGELDIFCGYYRDHAKISAVYLTLLPNYPVMLLERDKIEMRIKNHKRQHLPSDQSQEALANWPV